MVYVTPQKYFMDKWLKENLDEVPRFLRNSWDCVIIVSGHSKVRIGKTLKKGSKVLMSNGEWKNVEDIKIGDEVVSPQEDGTTTYEKVTDLHNRFEENCYDVIEESTKKILYSCSNNHSIPVYKNHLEKNKYELKIMEAEEISKFSSKNKNQFFCLKISFTNSEDIPLKVKYKKDRMSTSSFNRNHVYIKCVKSSPSEVYGFSITGKSKWHITDNWMITHNSTMALQIGAYLADLMKKPFADENIVFTPEELMEKSTKFPKNSILIYDEAMTGLNSSRAMENINKSMLDFFTECGQFGHIIIIVLPNYFRLSEDIAIPRSLFLIDVYADRKYNRGNFAFFNEVRKENLYIFGKKKLGTIARYTATNPNFRGKFTKFMPIDGEAYALRKKEAIRVKKLTRHQLKYIKQRDVLIWVMNKELKVASAKIAEKITTMTGDEITQQAISDAVGRISHPEG